MVFYGLFSGLRMVRLSKSGSRAGRAAGLLAVLHLALAAAVAAAPAAQASDDPPEFSGAYGQFTLVRPVKKAPFRTILGRDGEAIDLRQFRGKVILLNFWATWCTPCVVEMPSLDRLQAKLGGAKFQVVTLSVDRFGASRVLPFYAKNKLRNLGVYLDPRSETARAFGVGGLPITYLIDHRGMVQGYLKGHAAWDSKAALALIRYYLAKIPGP